jgi:transposase-like protein
MTMREVNMSKKRYPDEFKIEAVKQVVDAGHSVADVAGRLGMTTHSLFAWIRKFARILGTTHSFLRQNSLEGSMSRRGPGGEEKAGKAT